MDRALHSGGDLRSSDIGPHHSGHDLVSPLTSLYRRGGVYSSQDRERRRDRGREKREE